MLHTIKEYIRYYFRANTKYRVHSPSLFEFVNQVIEDKRDYYAFGKIEAYRSKLLNDHRTLEITDLGAGSFSGAGSNFGKKKTRTISQIAGTAVSSYMKCKKLFRIAHYYKPKSILELGTSLGISTSYLANIAQTTTIEGSESIAKVAQQLFADQKLEVNSLVGDIGENLNNLIRDKVRFDFIYADGNHREEATIQYFNQCLSLINENGVILFDDIYWSPGMTSAWKQIQQHPAVKRTIDLYTFGIVALGESDRTSHHTLISGKLKPFQFGFLTSKA